MLRSCWFRNEGKDAELATRHEASAALAEDMGVILALTVDGRQVAIAQAAETTRSANRTAGFVRMTEVAVRLGRWPKAIAALPRGHHDLTDRRPRPPFR